jgi:O-antigen/teichoic acid export membrane protein
MKRIIIFKNRIQKSGYVKNTMFLVTGSAIAQALPLLFSPILARLYKPEDFGVLATFLSFIAILGTISTFKLELAILVPKDEEEGLTLTRICMLLVLFFTIFITLNLLLFGNLLIQTLHLSHLNYYYLFLLFIPVSSFFFSYNTVLMNLNNRLIQYKTMGISQVTKSATAVITQLILGFLNFKQWGLVCGQFISYFTGNRVLAVKTKFRLPGMLKIKKPEFLYYTKKYKHFFLYAFPSSIINVLYLNLTNVFMSVSFSSRQVGLYSMTNKILGSPSYIISQSIGSVYYQRACREIDDKGTCSRSFIHTFLILASISLVVFTTAFFCVQWVIPLLLGKEWIKSVTIAHYVIPLFATNFISSPLALTLQATNRQKIGLVINTFRLLNVIVSYLLLAKYFDFDTTVLIFSLTASALSGILILYCFWVSKQKRL